jgi:hypothetical protein
MLKIFNINVFKKHALKDLKMHSRERTAWAWLVCLLMVPSIYFAGLNHSDWVPGNEELSRLAALSMPLIVMAFVALGVRAFNIVKTRQTGQELLDERDQWIEMKSTSVSYHVLMAGMIVVGMMMPFSATRWELVDTSFFFIVLAEVVHSCITIYGYRKGIHA